MDTAVPTAALPASILVLIYSLVCLTCSVLLAYMLISNNEKTGCEPFSSYCTTLPRLNLLTFFVDVTLITAFVTLSTTASIIQQVYYACEWRTVKTVALQQAKASAHQPSLAYGPLSTGLNLALYEIQFVCYSINAMLVLFWYVQQQLRAYHTFTEIVAGQ